MQKRSSASVLGEFADKWCKPALIVVAGWQLLLTVLGFAGFCLASHEMQDALLASEKYNYFKGYGDVTYHSFCFVLCFSVFLITRPRKSDGDSRAVLKYVTQISSAVLMVFIFTSVHFLNDYEHHRQISIAERILAQEQHKKDVADMESEVNLYISNVESVFKDKHDYEGKIDSYLAARPNPNYSRNA